MKRAQSPVCMMSAFALGRRLCQLRADVLLCQKPVRAISRMEIFASAKTRPSLIDKRLYQPLRQPRTKISVGQCPDKFRTRVVATKNSLAARQSAKCIDVVD
jgi:hypothetical protein